MASKAERLRKAYEFKLGADLAAKLTDSQLKILSAYYNSLDESEQSDIDNKIAMGMSNDLTDMARSMAEENEEPERPEESPPEGPPEDELEPEGPSGAITLYEGVRETDLVDEDVSETILRALGLEEVFDIDYGTYRTLLKERMMADRMGQTMDSAEAEAITEEFKRIKGKVGRFRIKKKTVETGGISAPGGANKGMKNFLALKGADTEPETQAEPTENFTKTNSILDEILSTIQNLFKFEQKRDAKNQRDADRKKKQGREDKLESGSGIGKGLAKAASAILKPIQGPLEAIINFLKYTFLTYIVKNLFKWFQNPDNQKKLESIGRFLKDWWPTLVAAYLLFGNRFSGLIRFLGKTLIKATARLLKFVVPKLLKLIASNPKAALATAVVGGAAVGGIMQSQTPSNDPERAAQGKTQLEDTQDFGGTTGAPISGDMLGFSGGGLVPNVEDSKQSVGKTKRYESGGQVEPEPPKKPDDLLPEEKTDKGVLDGLDGLLPFLSMGPLGIPLYAATKGVDKAEIEKKIQNIPNEALLPLGPLALPILSYKKGLEKKDSISTASNQDKTSQPKISEGDQTSISTSTDTSSTSSESNTSLTENILSTISNNPLMAAALGPAALPLMMMGKSNENGSDPESKESSTVINNGDEAEAGPLSWMMNPIAMGSSLLFGDNIFNANNKKDAVSTASNQEKKDPARDITTESGTDVTGAGSDTQLVPAKPGDIVMNKETVDAVGPAAFDSISSNTGEAITGAGPDTQMIAARPGEVIINKETVNRFGPGFFLGLNKKYGGSNANKPKMAKVQAASGGGFVLPAFSSGGLIAPGEQRDKETTPQSLGLPKDATEQEIKAAYDAKHGEGAYEKRIKAKQSETGTDFKVSPSESLVPSGDLNPSDTAGSRFNDLMKSTDPQKIADYDAKHGKDAYATKLKQKLGDIYSTDKAVEPQSKMIPTGKVVGRENLPAATVKVLEEMDAQKEGKLKPDIKTTGPLLGRMAKGMMGGLNNMMSGVTEKVKNAINDPKSLVESMGGTVVDSNSQAQNMKRVMSLPPDLRKSVLADMKRSGEVKEDTGMDIPGATADRQHIDAQPGEYIVPKKTTEEIGPDKLDKIVAQTDKNSTPAKLMPASKKPVPGPPVPEGTAGMQTLPTITGGSSGGGGSQGSSPQRQVPTFSATSPYAGDRQNNADIYGIR